MPSEKPVRRLEDIIENVHAIQLYVAGMNAAAFGKDQKTYDAVERCRALGNRLRHEYDAIREDRLWDIVQVDLPPLCAACEDADWQDRRR